MEFRHRMCMSNAKVSKLLIVTVPLGLVSDRRRLEMVSGQESCHTIGARTLVCGSQTLSHPWNKALQKPTKAGSPGTSLWTIVKLLAIGQKRVV